MTQVKTYYQVRGLNKYAAPDNFNEGIDDTRAAVGYINANFEAYNVADLVEKISDFLGVTNDAQNVMLDSCDELGRVDFNKFENDAGEDVSEAEHKQHEKGNIDLWYCTYSAYVMCIVEVSGVKTSEE